MCQRACNLQSNRFLPHEIIQAGRILKPATGLPKIEVVLPKKEVVSPEKEVIKEKIRISVAAPVTVQEKKKRWQDTLIKELSLPDITKAALIKNGITRAGKVENMGDEELMGLRGISQKSLKKIRKAIKKIKRQTINLV